MDLLSKILGPLIAPAKWLYSLCMDQTRVELIGQRPEGHKDQTLFVSGAGGRQGLLVFGVTTRSKTPVEINRIEVDYVTPLQLVDPGRRGFFHGSGSLRPTHPFRLEWRGNAIVRSDVIQTFGLTASFRDSSEEHTIYISVHASRQRHAIGGFVTSGRVRITEMLCEIRLTAEALPGICVPPNCSLTSPQPFLIEQAVTASGSSLSVHVHESFANGTVATKHVKSPSD